MGPEYEADLTIKMGKNQEILPPDGRSIYEGLGTVKPVRHLQSWSRSTTRPGSVSELHLRNGLTLASAGLRIPPLACERIQLLCVS